ncbi:uncharacterized protein F5891DRAFT_1051327 [Suillus fuscotomentosus]|uniref:Arrestin C-terminal-like domain-containing protein n=1 Tax=Suillus fuscotomentosus TaxID=1912939 RepID=A0AAD4DZJ5_9AGAM|nr:uncharacterized protein F5891DRAFT_1051327 [Suillus fuscotomentosus]KAG1896857.1 hypothetical protein F5891DRAFT_1051327 [Suillus fuscotomentosus]
MALQSRPVPMNASPHHSKVKVSLTLSDPIFVAGNNISGKMEVECRGDGDCGLGIGLMMVELFAVQEITSRDHSGTSTFIHSRRLFQGPGLPPSNAIQSDFDPPGESHLPAHYYPARRGLTTFFFRFPLPPSSPASISFGPAQIRYEIRASVGVAWRGEKRLVTDHQYVNIVEYCDIRAPSKRPQGFAVAEGGNIWAQTFVTNGPIIAGEVACVELQLKNHSLNWTCGITLTLSRELRLSSPSVDNDTFKITDTVTEVEFRSHEYMVPPGIEGVANLVINIPRSSRGSRGGARVGENGNTTDCLFEVRCSLRLRIDMPIGSEPVIITIPLVIHHPLAVPNAHASPYAIPATSPQPYASPPTHAYLLPLPSGASYVDPHFSSQQYDPLHTYWPPPSLSADYKPLTPAFSEQHYPRDLFPSNPHFQHYTPPPPRPASAEPHSQMPYYDTSLPSGLPTSVAHLLLPHPPISYHPSQAAESSPQYLADSEEGKGTRASRISQTLRLSSRHRSVSPLSHRFSLPQPSAQHVSPGRPYGAIQISTLPNPYDSQSALHSPRPIPSPKQSYSGPSPRSENVCALERMADEVGRHSGDLSADLPKCAADVDSNVDKMLPSPPVPSGKRPLHVRQHVQAAFSDITVPGCSAPKPELGSAYPLPPMPPLAAITPVKFPRAPCELSGLSTNYIKGSPQESGLDALERRLLAEVGTRRQDVGELRPDVCSVVQPIKIPASGAPAGVNDSTISSLTLADRDAFLRGDEDEREQEQEQDHDSDERTQHRGGRHSQSDDEREVRTQRGRGKVKSKHNDEDDERQVTQKRERKRGKVGDMRKLRSEVKGRIAAWLGEIDTSPPLVDDSLSMVSPAASHFVPITDNKPFAPPSLSEDLLPLSGNQELGGIPFDNDVSAAPNPRSSGFVTISTLKAASTGHSTAPAPENVHSSFDAEKKNPAAELLAPGPILRRMSTGQSATVTPIGSFLNAPLAGSKSPDITRADLISTVTPHFLSPHHSRHSPKPPSPEVIRSARGGKGGRVTEVASLWAAKADTTQIQAKKHEASQPLKKPVNHGRKLSVRSPLSTSQTQGPADTSREGRGKATKATTVPAVISSSHAVPMLSSTASLARASPNPRTPASRPLPPMISETISNLRSVVKTPIPRVTRTPSDLGFGQARLRDLIKKYQG